MKTFQTTIGMLAAAALLAGCGGAAAFTNLFPDNKPEQIDDVLSKVGAPGATTEPANGTGAPIVVAVTDAGAGLAAVNLESGKEIWTAAVQVDSQPVVGPGVVMLRSGDDIVAFDVQSGSRLWDKALEERFLYGFAFDGNAVFVTQGNTDGGISGTGRRGLIWALDAHKGSKRWEIPVDKMLGAPAARNGFVFVPWDRQSITVLAAESGDEMCRLLRRDGTVDWVRAVPEGIFYGSASDILRLTGRSASGVKDDVPHVDFDPTEIPGQPSLWFDTFENSKADHGARARIRLLWSPRPETGEDAMGLGDDSVYFVYYKYIIALDAGSGHARWVHYTEESVSWAEAGTAGVWYIGESGDVVFLDGASGGSATVASIGGTVLSATFDTGAHDPGAEGEARKLLWGLRDLVFDVDTQVLPLRKYALKLMADLPQEEVTMDLLEILRSAHVPKAMRDQAALMLRTREGGVEFLKEALKYHADYLQDTGPPPVGAIASSLANAGDKSALPMLLDHLRDHETPMDDLVELTEAILVLGDVSALPDLQQFLVMYHADSSFATNVDVLVNVAEAIAKFGGEEGKQFVMDVIADPWTGGVVKSKLAAAVK